MEFLEYLKAHTIVSIGKPIDDMCVISEIISDNPEKLIEQVFVNNYYIPEIFWWEKTSIFETPKIGYGGTLDPRNPEKYYFAETGISNSFDKETTISEYIEYLNSIKAKYFKYDLHPAFDIYRK